MEDALTTLLRGHRGDLVLVALPGTYLRLIGDELVALPKSQRTRLRIIGPRRRSELNEVLQSQWVPYDGRLDNKRSGFNGTGSDFPQRALRHFVTQVLPQAPNADSASHAMIVAATLGHLRPYVRSRGRNASDDELLSRLATLWGRFAGRRKYILRELRGRLGIACEQGRFKRLADIYVESRHGTA
jgi:hypothetical protein